MTVPAWLYDAGPNGHWVFLLVTVVLGGSAAWATGRAIAQTWRPAWQIPVYAGLLMLAVRFLHYGLFEEPMLAAGNAIVDYVVLLGAAVAGQRVARAEQLRQQYHWLFESHGGIGAGQDPLGRRPSNADSR